MQIICPNCEAKYQVNDKAIPEDGRDVQCTNCGEIWFQEHRHILLLLKDSTNIENAPRTEPTQQPKTKIDSNIQSILQDEAKYSTSATQSNQAASTFDRDTGASKAQELKHILNTVRPQQDYSVQTEFVPEKKQAIQTSSNTTRISAFANGMIASIISTTCLTGLYSASPQLAELFPDSHPFFENIRYGGDQLRFVFQDLYYTGDAHGIENMVANLKILLLR